MTEVKGARHVTESDAVIERAKDFWSQYGKIVTIVLGAAIVLVGGVLIYKNFIKAPKEKKAAEAIFRAQEYYEKDSLDKALKGDGQYPGFETVISQYGSTDAGELAKFYAGSIYLKKGSFDKAAKYLKDFSTDAPQIQARAYKLLGDALSEQGKGKDAIDYYKKAASTFEEDETGAAEALFFAAYLADKVLNDKNQAVELYKEIKTKYPHAPTQWVNEADKYLAAHGVYNAE
ncbi:tetratricopeptide repeat protein [Flavisolibacter ginsenosidimutans]|uniref:Tetratricopeptide repeat protein n=1 Tax=Flavisolibacter ginsenosidimutans TaxID=661481 RepID=A0A5B8UEG2_9BACT|nr:tetratricopeptide repeat protein [Flavisolibacter ginsenosidimutans]QEC54954.1 tetratricopeptide repeat protein [Flavisolibacter ginsenosidimutans]